MIPRLCERQVERTVEKPRKTSKPRGEVPSGAKAGIDFGARRLALCCGIAVVALAIAAAALGSEALAAEDVSILETGSSLLYPLFNAWVPVFQAMHPDVRITTQSTGSGAGISQALAGIAQIGASDAYLPDAMVRMHPDLMNIPLAISSQMANYNLPGLNGRHIKLSGPALAEIYSGAIRMWNDRAIAEMNPDVDLPRHAIIPIHRGDGSGDTFVFTQYLAFSDASWANRYGYGVTVSWPPVPGSLGAEGNPGMMTALEGNPYSVAYVGSSYEDGIDKAGIGTAELKNRDGNYVLPTEATVKAAAVQAISKTPADGRASLIFAPGTESYPIVNFEYAIVKQHQPTPEIAQALRAFFTWIVSPNGGNAAHFLEPLHFVALPPTVVSRASAQIAKIQ